MKRVIIFFVILLSFSSISFSAAESSEYNVEQVTVNTVSAHADSDMRGQNSTYVDPYKQAANSGETKVNLVSNNCDTDEYEYAEIKDEEIQFGGCSSSFDTAINQVGGFDLSDGNDIIMQNGNIVYADEAISYTIGGINYVGMIYPTVEDANNATNGITISGGAFDMAYYGTTSYNNKLYYEVMVGGLRGYIEASEAAILPTEMIKSQSYYVKEGNELIYYYSVSPITNEYASMVLGLASTEMQEGVKYYTYDDVNYYTSPMTDTVNSNSAILVDYNYWQNLPVTSTSSATAQEYKNYLNYKGKSSSEYINETDGFVTAEDNYGFNSTLLFAHANLESAYGTSTYARTCHNFFGMGAYDSNPDNACNSSNGGVDFQKDDQIDDAIVAQSIFMKENYQDIYDWRFYGNHFGNKSAGFNVYYATDPNWGKSVGSIAYEFDKYANNLETGYYTIAQTTSYTEVYSTPTGSSTYTLNASQNSTSGPYYEYAYRKGGVASSGSTSGMNIIILDDSQSRYQIQLPTPIKHGSEACNNVDTSTGYMHNFNGTQAINISGGQASSYCKYGWSDEKGYINKSDVKIINDVDPKPIGSKYTIIDYPQPVIMKTTNPNTITYYGNTIPLENTYIPVVGKVFLNNTLKGWVYISDPLTGTYDAIFAGDLYALSASADNVTLGTTSGSSNINIYEASNTSSKVEATVSPKNIPLSITNVTNSQNINGNTQWNYVRYQYFTEYVTTSNGWAPDAYIKQYKPTTYVGYDNVVTFDENGNLKLDGYGYIKYVDASMESTINHSIQIKDSSGNVVYTKAATDTNKYKSTVDGHEEGVYIYDYASYNTTINIPSLNLKNGTYSINLVIDQAGYNVEAPYNIHSTYDIDETIYLNGATYRVYTNENSKLMLDVKTYNPTVYKGYDNKVYLDSSGNINVNGYAYIQYVDIPNDSSITKTLQVVDSSGKVVKSQVLTDNTSYKSTTATHDNGTYDYSYAGYSGKINISDLAPGTYTFKLKVDAGGFSVTTPYVTHASYSYSNQIYLNGKIYKLYTTNSTIKLEVSNYNPTTYKGYDNKIYLDESGNIYFDGYAYIQYIEIPSSSSIKKTVEVVNANGEVVKSQVMTDNTNYIGATDTHDGGKYNYDYAGYNGTINISDLGIGTYTFNLKVEAGSEVVTNAYKTHSSYNYSKQIYLNGKIYKLYTSNSTIKLDISEYNPTNYKGYDNKVYLDSNGNINFNGYAYIQYINIPNSSSTSKIVNIKDSNGNVVMSAEMLDTNEYSSTVASHDNGKYNYHAAGYKGSINVSSLAPGTYNFTLNVNSGGYEVEVPYVTHSTYSYNTTYIVNGKSYNLYTQNGTIYLKVANYTPTSYVGYDNKVYIDEQGVIHFDGYAYLQYIACPNSSSIKKTIQVKDNTGKVVYELEALDTNKYASTVANHDGGKYDYNAAGYSASMNLKNLNLTPGLYTFNLKVEAGGIIVNVPYKIHSSYNYNETVVIEDISYHLFTSGGSLKLEIK